MALRVGSSQQSKSAERPLDASSCVASCASASSPTSAVWMAGAEARICLAFGRPAALRRIATSQAAAACRSSGGQATACCSSTRPST
eukprot:scaffold133532_cov26-Tisochrysis_lutea.AAC.3